MLLILERVLEHTCRCGQSIPLFRLSAWMTVEVRLLKYYGPQVSICHQDMDIVWLK